MIGLGFSKGQAVLAISSSPAHLSTHGGSLRSQNRATSGCHHRWMNTALLIHLWWQKQPRDTQGRVPEKEDDFLQSSFVCDHITIATYILYYAFFFPVNHFNSCILCFTSYDVISHYGIFLCCVSPWRLTKKGVTCRRITTCLHMIESNYPAVVGICTVIFWNVAPCGLVNSCWYCSGVYCVFKQYKKTLDSEDRGKTLLREVGIYLSTGRNILEGLYVQLKAIWRYGVRRVCWVGQGVQGGGPRSSWGTIPIFPGENE